MLRRAGAMTSQCLTGRVRLAADWRTSAPACSASRCWYARIFSGCADDLRPCKNMHLKEEHKTKSAHISVTAASQTGKSALELHQKGENSTLIKHCMRCIRRWSRHSICTTTRGAHAPGRLYVPHVRGIVGLIPG